MWGPKAEYPYLCIELFPEFSELLEISWSYASYTLLHWKSLYSVIFFAFYTVDFLFLFSFLFLLTIALILPKTNEKLIYLQIYGMHLANE